MKKILSYFIYIISSIFISSCNGDEDIQSLMLEESSSDSSYVVSFGTVDFDEEQDTRATSQKTIYGINVEYYKNGIRQGYYAYGLFDDMSNASITLIGGFTYSFTCSIVRSAGDQLWYGPYSSNSFSGYAAPFQLNNSVSTQCQNKFVEGTGNYLSGLGAGAAVVKSSAASSGYVSKENPSLERYFGKYTNFNPATDGTKVVIPVVKAYFGCKLIVKSVENGVLSTRCSSSNNLPFLSASVTNSDFISDPQIYSFRDVASCWTNNSYSSKVSVEYYYASKNRNLAGAPDWWNLSGSKEITFKRNVLTTITISVTEDMSGASVGIADEAMEEDNVIEFEVDENYNLNQKNN